MYFFCNYIFFIQKKKLLRVVLLQLLQMLSMVVTCYSILLIRVAVVITVIAAMETMYHANCNFTF